ncbi:NAD-dependent epimerase/dehydratase family protein [Gammaproteobacteria bacterium]|nr:NAD-dependent epimerase/dehydratase family protein [Gammaproteobacteria bacterium]
MEILVTGGLGFFGSFLVKAFNDRGNKCNVLDITENEGCPNQNSYIKADIRDYKAVKKACEGMEIVHHNVAQVPLAKNRKAFKSVNVDGTGNILKAALECGVKKVIYMSSSAVFGVPQHNPVKDSTVPNPKESYGAAKYAGELICEEYRRKGLDVTIVRPRTIMGHGRLGIFQILFEWIREGRNVPVLGKGNNVYQFICADDLANACILAGLRSGAATYNCGAEGFGSMREVLENLCRHAGTGSKVVSVPVKLTTMAMEITSRLGLSPLGPYHSMMYGR